MLVKDRMIKHPLTISTEESLSGAHQYMQQQKIRHLPVVDKTGKMVGLVTEDDLLKAGPSKATLLSVWEIHSLLTKVKVKEVMVKTVITTTEDTPFEEAAHQMLDHKIGCLPVLRDGKLVGIVTESDVFRTFMELFAARQKGLRITMEVPSREGELALIGQTVAGLGGDIVACGVFEAADPVKAGLVLKVRNVDREVVLSSLAQNAEAEILDVRDI
jgi:acetoin utilization protein AcuB